MKRILIVTFLLFTIQLFSQNTFFIGNKTYEATDEVVLKSKESIGGQNLNVMIAKNGESGLFIVSTKLYFEDLRIKGKLLIYLDDKTVITCIDKNNYDYVDNTATTIYSLTNEEIEKLRNSNIYSVRFSVKSIRQDSSAPSEGSYSARNYPDQTFFEEDRVNFPSLITNLF